MSVGLNIAETIFLASTNWFHTLLLSQLFTTVYSILHEQIEISETFYDHKESGNSSLSP